MSAAQDYRGKKILVLGLARSGRAACSLLLKYGADITGYDIKGLDELNELPARIKNNVEFKCGITPRNLNPSRYDKIVASPGIPPDNPVIKKALKLNVPVISELQLGLESLPEVKIVAVTGTNGKTTTCKMLEYITGAKAAGNIGTPLTSQIENIKEGDLVILEVSSYQIPFSSSLIPDVGIMLNIFPEHLTWHQDFESYVSAKKEMFLRQPSTHIGIFNADIENIDEFLKGVKSRKVFFSSNKDVKEGVCIKGDNIVFIYESGEENIISERELTLPGAHNVENLMAAIAAWKCLGGVKLPGLKQFKLPPHRLEEIGVFGGVKFINDSKATNMDSTLRAVESSEKPIILFMGGRSKNQLHPGLLRMVKDKVKKIIAFGESSKEIYRYFSGVVPVVEVAGLKEATKIGFRYAIPGDTVLLSPGGSSFDEFNDYCERGVKFKEWVQEMADGR